MPVGLRSTRRTTRGRARRAPARRCHPARKSTRVDASTASRPRCSIEVDPVKTPTRVSVGSATRCGAPPRVGGRRRRHDDHEPEALAGVAFELAERRAELDRRQHAQRLRRHVGAAQVDPAGDEPRGEAGAVGAEHEAARGDDRPLEHVGLLLADRGGIGVAIAVEHDDATSDPLRLVLADLQLLGAGRRLPVDRALLVAGDVVAQAVELARSDALREREQVAAEDAAAEGGHRQFERLRGDGDLGRSGDRPLVDGEPEQVAALEGGRADQQHAATCRRDAVPGGDLGARAERPPPSCAPCWTRRRAR